MQGIATDAGMERCGDAPFHLRHGRLSLGHLHGMGQCDSSGCYAGPYPESDSRRALASCKSAVSKPSVNHS